MTHNLEPGDIVENPVNGDLFEVWDVGEVLVTVQDLEHGVFLNWRGADLQFLEKSEVVE